MQGSLDYLDRAIELGRKELDSLKAGDVEQAERLARSRGGLTEKALEVRQGVSVEALVDKLTELRSLQGRITGEARRLHASLKADLLKIRKEGRRHSAYHGAVAAGHGVQSRFVSKKG
ncbi:MAG: hypothetical protein PHV85_08600 [Desulfovibrionaceae bacterium]|nr:hypothetical protein [Desulfovibrionaceae bacterium]MDD4952594.1 hypothetical protein [Desulfovibrionaceae bacterium]